MLIVREPVSRPVQPIEPAALRAHPERSRAILEDRLHRPIAEAIGVSGIVPIVRKSSGGSVEPVQGGRGSNPQFTTAALTERRNQIVR